jgi:hypothetical protein
MARPGRKKGSLTQSQKDERKAAKNADKAQALASNALAKLPTEKERRDELFREADALKSEAQSVSGQISQHKKRMLEVFGITKEAIQIRNILVKCKDGVYEATCQQVQLFLQDIGRPFQLSLALEPGKGVAEDSGSVFDHSNTGQRQAAEQGGDPGKATRGRGRPPGSKNKPKDDTPTPGIPLGEAEKAFEANAHKAPAPAANGNGTEETYAQTLARENAAEAPLTRRRGRPPKDKSEVKEVADQYVQEQEERLGPASEEPPPAPRSNDPLEGAEHGGTYVLN